MEYTLACIWCYYYDDGLEITLYLHPLAVAFLGLGGGGLPVKSAGLLLAERDVSLRSCLLKPALTVGALDVVRIWGRGLGRGEGCTCSVP